MASTYTPRTAPDPNEKGFPAGIKYIIGNEGCERFSYYGMRAILYVYIVGLYLNLSGMVRVDYGVQALAQIHDVMGLGAFALTLVDLQDKADALSHYHLWGAAVYALPLIGAMLADRLLGKYMTILSLSVIYCLGHLALALFEDPNNMFGVDPITGLYIGLGLIAVGSGGIKPCVSAHVGDQFGKSNWHLLQKIYNAFYFIINFGSAFATLIIPAIRGAEDPLMPGVYEGSVGWAFGIPGILMGLATIAFWMGRKVFVHVPATHPGKKGLLDVLSGTALFMVIGWPIFFGEMTAGWVIDLIIASACFSAFVILFNIRQRIEPDDGFLALTFFAVKAKLTGRDVGPGEAPTSDRVDDLRDHWLYGPVARKHGSHIAEGPMAVWKIISVFIFISVFWALFDQHSSTWIEQAKAMDRVIDLSDTGYYLTGLGIGLLFGVITVISIEKGTAVPRWAMWVVGAALGGTLFWILNLETEYGAEEWLLLTLYMTGGGAVFEGAQRASRSRWLVFAVFLGIGAMIGYALTVLGPIELQPSQIPALNPFMVMILIPLTTFGLYPLMKKIGIDPHPLRRMTMGMMTAGISFVLVALIQAQLDDGQQVHIVWQVLPYLVITLAEVMVSITGLEFAYSQAPKRMKSVIMGFWLFNVTLGNLLVALIAKMPDMNPEAFFWTFAGLMFAAGTLFGIRGKFYRYKDYTQDADTAEGAA